MLDTLDRHIPRRHFLEAVYVTVIALLAVSCARPTGDLGGGSTPEKADGAWFVTLADQPHLEGRYTAFGRVVQNFDGVCALMEPEDRIVSIRVYEGDGTEPLPPLP